MPDFRAEKFNKEAREDSDKVLKQLNLKENDDIAKEDDPMLPPGSCELIFMRNVFHHIMNPESYFQRLKESLKPGGRIAVIDWKPEARHGHGTPEEEILSVVESAGFRRTEHFRLP